MNITTVNFGVLLDSLGCINHDAAVLTRSTQPKMQLKEKPQKKILLALLFLCQIAFAQNYSLNFDGVDDYVELQPIDLSAENTLTFSSDIWIDGFTQNIVLLRQDGAQFDWLLQINENGSFIESQIITDTHNQAGIWHYIDADDFLNKWNNIATTYDGEYIHIYINGELVQTGTWGGIINYNEGNNLYFGGSPMLNDYYLIYH